jgi:hypothetical protein
VVISCVAGTGMLRWVQDERGVRLLGGSSSSKVMTVSLVVSICGSTNGAMKGLQVGFT